MQTKPLLYGLIGFLLGGLLVSTVAAKQKSENVDSMSGMVTSLQGKTGDDYDRAFVSEMIEHHQAAVDMAKMSESQAKHQEIKDLSKAIIETQQQEIEQMRQWQSQWGYSDTQMNGMH